MLHLLSTLINSSSVEIIIALMAPIKRYTDLITIVVRTLSLRAERFLGGCSAFLYLRSRGSVGHIVYVVYTYRTCDDFTDDISVQSFKKEIARPIKGELPRKFDRCSISAKNLERE